VIAISIIVIAILSGITLYGLYIFDPKQATRPISHFPKSIAVVGDSISVGFNTRQTNQATLANNWATGTNSEVNSIAARIAKERSIATLPSTNVAKPGAESNDLSNQVRKVAVKNPDAVLVLIGANDICTSGGQTNGMTSVTLFQSRIRESLHAIDAQTDIFVGSVVNMQNLLDIGAADSDVQAVWAKANICKVMLTRPSSTAPEDIVRREAVNVRVADYNKVLKDECEQLRNCTYDQGATFKIVFDKSDVSPTDYFHPSINGQAKLAEAFWPVIQQKYQL
jgi:lysophospholipase L1-like esterase